MASQNCPQNLTVGDLELACDLCQSDEIVETEQGYVCSACGVVLEVTKLEYHRPYEETRVQHAVLGTTQIGHTHERSRTKHSRKYHKLHKISKSVTSNSQVDTSARVIIRRLVEKLDLPYSLRESLFTKYKQARSEFEP
ncbi:MAG: hypothetical protein GF311_14525, partial [Candidatus Lokiarchaeota archaeon]|nr:hypothetical protein [Candidatus Lokiarchaeota archaeon]